MIYVARYLYIVNFPVIFYILFAQNSIYVINPRVGGAIEPVADESLEAEPCGTEKKSDR